MFWMNEKKSVFANTQKGFVSDVLDRDLGGPWCGIPEAGVILSLEFMKQHRRQG